MPYVQANRESAHYQEEATVSVGRRSRTPQGSESCSMITVVWVPKENQALNDCLVGQVYTSSFMMFATGGVFYGFIKDGGNTSRSVLMGIPSSASGIVSPVIMGFSYKNGTHFATSTANYAVDEITGLTGFTPHGGTQFGILGNGGNTTRTATGVAMTALWVSNTYGFTSHQAFIDELNRWKDRLESGRELEPIQSNPDEDFFWHAEDAHENAWVDRVSKLYMRKESPDRRFTFGSIPARF